jgi:hypothetical protein
MFQRRNGPFVAREVATRAEQPNRRARGCRSTLSLINSDYRNDAETNELIASEIMPHFA